MVNDMKLFKHVHENAKFTLKLMHLVTLIDKNFQKLSEICLIEGLITEDIISDDIKRHRLGYF